MNSLKTLALIAGLALAGSNLAAQSGLSQKLRAYYNRYSELAAKKDVQGLAKFMTENSTADYRDIHLPDAAGHVQKTDLAEAVRDMKRGMAMLGTITKFAVHIEHLKPQQTSAVAIIHLTLACTLGKTPDGKVHKMALDERSEETWVKVGSRWKIKSSRTIKDSGTVDGIPVPQG